jgi:hypothetical protein
MRSPNGCPSVARLLARTTGILAIREAPVRRFSGPVRAYLIGESRLKEPTSYSRGLYADMACELEIIVPSAESRTLGQDLAEYDRLCGQARRVTRLPFVEDGPAAHMAASLVMVRAQRRADRCLGRPAGTPLSQDRGCGHLPGGRVVDRILLALDGCAGARVEAEVALTHEPPHPHRLPGREQVVRALGPQTVGQRKARSK